MGGYSDPDKPQSWVADLYDAIGPTRLVLVLLAGASFLVAYFWLQAQLGWPEHYGFECRGKGCIIDDAWHSPALLQHHKPYEIALFVCIWVMVAFLLSPLIVFVVAKLRGNKSKTNSDAGV